jgi:hypothetical protein
MRFFKIILFFSLFSLSFCEEKVKPITLQDDKVLEAIKKEITELEKDKGALVERNQSISNKIEEMTLSPKFTELLKKQRFTNGRFIELIDQAINYRKLRSIERERYVNENLAKLKAEDLTTQFDEYTLDQKANPPSFPWRKKAASASSKKKAEEKPAEKKEEPPAGGHH